MFEVHADKTEQLLTIRYSGRVDVAETERCARSIRDALADMRPGFSLLTDLTGLETMELACAAHIEEIMRLCDEKKIQTVLRVIPDPTKDIGFTIMSRFHYAPTVDLRTYDTLADALQSL